MATLNFSFAGESINAAKLEPKVRKFELQFENPVYAELNRATPYSIEYFYSIDRYAENLSEAIHLSAAELGVAIGNLVIRIVGYINTTKYNNRQQLFNKVDVALEITANASDAILNEVLKLARELNPVDERIGNKVQFNYSLNTIIHLN
ncbi:hypothetical protein [Taibaiella chishuiensis]|uniref:OsmC-like protein n=1 Tax=Taibaiella chishuiensis TaxID=1434707 RepID=A0A2P8CZE2_9BACT|nr:hypothetical protein [Taibaiella chishuiensis]PSK90333.1 hypothetical protein B0I18_10862 [Taibaiella chishuiensis]